MKVTVGKIKKRKIILLNFVILLFVAYWLGVFFIFYRQPHERIMFSIVFYNYFIIHLYLGTSWINFYEYNVGSRSKFFKIYSFRSQFR